MLKGTIHSISVDIFTVTITEIADGLSVEIANSKLYSGSLLIRKRSMFDIKKHAISDRPVLEWLSKCKPDQKWEVEYIGWNYRNEGKPQEAEVFLYYNIR